MDNIKQRDFEYGKVNGNGGEIQLVVRFGISDAEIYISVIRGLIWLYVVTDFLKSSM
jgi:hypothetical protein